MRVTVVFRFGPRLRAGSPLGPHFDLVAFMPRGSVGNEYATKREVSSSCGR